jgi:hypothetical protein
MFDELDEFEPEQLVLHESAHLRLGDDYALILQRIIEAVFGFYPVVWWIRRHIEFEREVACDDFVVEWTGHAPKCTRCLTHAAEVAVGAGSYPLAGFAAQTSRRLEKRGDMLHLLLDKTQTVGTKLLWVRAVSMVVSLIAVSAALVEQPGFVMFGQSVPARLESVQDASGPIPADVSNSASIPTLANGDGTFPDSSETVSRIPVEQEASLARSPAVPAGSDLTVVRIPVTVTDSRDSFVTGLGLEHFRLFVDGEETVISEFSIPGEPTVLAIVNELSQTVERRMESELTRQVVEQVLGSGARSVSNIFLLASAETTGPDSLEAQLETAATHMRSTGNSGRAILIVSGSTEHWAAYSEEQIRDVSAALDLPIYAVSRGGDSSSGAGATGAARGRAVLDQVTRDTGGLHLVVDETGAVQRIANRIQSGMRSLYVLGFESDSSRQDERHRRIDVQVVAPNRAVPLSVVHRMGSGSSPARPVSDLPTTDQTDEAAAGRFDRFQIREEQTGRGVAVARNKVPAISSQPVGAQPEPPVGEPGETPTAQERSEQGPRTEVTGLGRIVEINAEERWFELRSRVPGPVQARTSDTGTWGGSVGVGGGLPAREPRVIRVPDDPRTGQPALDPRVDPKTGRRDPRLDPRLPTPILLPLPGGPTPGRMGYITSRIIVTATTIIQHNGRALRFGQLRVGDSVQLTGMTRGIEVEATQIDMQFRGP